MPLALNFYIFLVVCYLTHIFFLFLCLSLTTRTAAADLETALGWSFVCVL